MVICGVLIILADLIDISIVTHSLMNPEFNSDYCFKIPFTVYYYVYEDMRSPPDEPHLA